MRWRKRRDIGERLAGGGVLIMRADDRTIPPHDWDEVLRGAMTPMDSTAVLPTTVVVPSGTWDRRGPDLERFIYAELRRQGVRRKEARRMARFRP